MTILMERILILHIAALLQEKLSSVFSTRSGTNQTVQPKIMARSLTLLLENREIILSKQRKAMALIIWLSFQNLPSDLANVNE